MGSLVLDVLRKGIWSSFTGGWYYDPSSATFTNTFHLYLFLFFLCFPFSVYVYLPRNAVNWLIYTSVVACVFVAVKLINFGLHRMFDTSECIVEEPSSIDITLECDKRKPSQKPETRGEEEGIELQVLSSDKKRDNQNENNSSFGSLEFADFNATAIKDDVQATTSGTIDLKVDVHRKNSSDSSDGTFFRSDKVIVVDEVSQESSKEKISSVSEQRVPDVTSSEEVLVGKDLDSKNVRKRNLGVKEGTAQDGSTTVDVSDGSGGRLSERSRQYSVSVTLGEGKEENTINDPTPARSMQLNSELEADSNKSPGDKGLLYWKQKWAKNPRYSHGRVNATMPPEISISGTSRRSSSPLSIYTSDIVYPIAEHSDEQPITSIKRSSAHSDDDDDDDEDYVRRHNPDDDDMYGDIDDDPDVEMDSSHSPLLSAKHNSSGDNNGSTYNIGSYRKKRYVDSLTRKYKHMLKNRNEIEIDDMFTRSNAKCAGDQNQNESLPKDEDEQAEDYHHEPPSEDDDQIAAIFDWLFSQNGNERGSTSENLNHTPSAKELKSTKKVKKLDPLEARMKEFEELKAKYPNYLHATKSQSKFSSTPTLASGGEKSYSHRRQRSGTCSQLEINLTLPSNERKSSLNEVTGQCTSVDVYTSTEDQKLEPGCPRTTESNEASSSGSNNELSSLLPFPCVTPYINSPSSMHFYHGRRTALRYDSRNNRNRHRRQTRRSRSSIREAFPSASSIQTTHREPNDFTNFVRNLCRSEAADLDGACSTHIATSYDDTTEGAVHIFQDENGQWMSYTFDERGSGIAVNVEAMARRKEAPLNSIEEHNKNTSCASLRIDNCTTYVNSSLRQPSLEAGPATATSSGASTSSAAQPTTSEQPSHSSHLYQLREHDNGTYSLGTVDHPVLLSIPYNQTFVNSAYPSLRFNPLARLRMPSHVPVPGSQPELHLDLAPIMPRRFDYIDAIEVPDDEKQKRRYYKFRLFPFSYVKIYFDRLSLDALLDFNETYCETLLCIVLAVMVSMLGAVMLHMKYYHDIPAFIFCFVIATSHYSLLKSVQPDAASPVHGFNKVVAFSRPVYFVVCCSLIIGLNSLLRSNISWMSFTIYDVHFDMHDAVKSTHDFLCTFILFFPVFFTLGMFPQINTFLMYVFEQIDMHVFGGSAVTSLKAAAYCVFRSVLAVLLLFGFAYGALSEPKSSQHILFSIFISLLVMFAYHLSRCTCDPAPIWNILVKQFWPIDEIAKETKELRKNKERKAKEDAKNKKITAAQAKDAKLEQGDKDKEHVEEISVGHQDGSRPANVKKRNLLEDDNDDLDDPLPAHVQKVVNARLQSDLITSCIACVLIFSIHRSTIFTNLQPELNPIMWSVACFIGFLLHYIMPQLRKQLPWLCIARPVLRSIEHELFEAQAPATVTWFEKVYMYLGFVEKNIIYPVMFIGCLTSEAPRFADRFGPLASSLILTVCSLKCLRLSFSHPSSQYLILAFSVLFFRLEFTTEAFVVDYFLISIVYYKLYDLLLKIQFVLTYIAPWQITWGSAFHAFAQPFSLPHSAMMFAQAVLSAFLSSPLYPFLGSAIFLTSYPRPVKFWERDYNTRRVDHSNTKMASHLERNLGADDNNLNSIFYEHLTRSLQRSLCGDLLMGRWGEVSAGDCFILASDYLNCLIHIVEFGNGLVTFQMRGLEFRGTYCQQREVEAITDGVEENDGCCCCKPGHLPFMLSLNAAFSQRWLAWEVTTGKYILEGYSISDNSAASMLQVFDFRKMLISYYVKSIIYYAVMSPKLEEWISSPGIREALQTIKDKTFVDLDPVFNMNIDEDYDYRYSGITKNSFCSVYVNWIRYCNSQREKPIADVGKDSSLVTLCFALSLLGRRTLGTASHNTAASVEFFLYGVHTLFKGDFRIASVRDEWVFSDMELLRKVVAPAIRMSLKLHQDHFMAPDEYECSPALFSAISSHQENLVISHEGDPVWRKAVLSGMPSLLALRRVMEEGSDDYKIIMLNKRFLSFRVIKMNRECVRGLWAGQQQELIFLRNLNSERGSIQNAKQALRNIINSSCDQPIGYPIFVSPLTTSYAETNAQYTHYFGGPVSIKSIKNFVFNFCRRVRKRCVEGCSSGSSAHSQDDGGFGHEGVYSMTTFNVHSGSHQSMETSLTGSGGTITRVSAPSSLNRSAPSPAGPSKPGLVTLAGLLSPPGNPIPENIKLAERKPVEKEDDEKEPILHRVKIIDPGQVHDGINQGRLIDVIWPDEVMRQRGGRNFWKDWVPEAGMEGQVVHRWIPNHPNPNKRSTFDRTILLVKIEDKYVPISENGVQDLGAEV